MSDLSGRFEQYVSPAAVAIDPAAFDETIENHAGLIRQFRRDRAIELAQAVLGAVAPLIEEDTRTRMVEAAAAAVKRELHADCDATHPDASHIPCIKSPGHGGDHVSRGGRNWRTGGAS
ncbi:hypothetical protein ACFPJ1_40850 [Kribbella qitaiheensis]|uniref:hypothetical protein n=1 Tax=Kribbella qitaiheensis TaxID=1544730 RepID=UPI00360B6B72